LFAATARLVEMAIELLEGDLVAADRILAAIKVEPPAGRALLGPQIHLYLEARVREAEGGPGLVADLLEPVFEDPAAYRRILSDLPSSAPWLVRVALANGRMDAATAVVSATSWLVSANPGLATAIASAGQSDGLLRADPEALAGAAAQHVQPWARASAEEDAAGAWLPTDPARSLDHLKRALRLYSQIGSQRDAARIRSRMRKIGVHPAQRGVPGSGMTGWDSLSAAELRVARTVGGGLTNAEAARQLTLSPHTVDFHLRSVFDKLGITSRAALVRIAVKREAAEATEDEPGSSGNRESNAS
jgi:DNA-binding CsgD family transcriptional regulator